MLLYVLWITLWRRKDSMHQGDITNIFNFGYLRVLSDIHRTLVQPTWGQYQATASPASSQRYIFINLFTTIHDGNFRRHSSMNVTIKWHKFSSNIYYIYVFFVISYLDPGTHPGLEVKGLKDPGRFLTLKARVERWWKSFMTAVTWRTRIKYNRDRVRSGSSGEQSAGNGPRANCDKTRCKVIQTWWG